MLNTKQALPVKQIPSAPNYRITHDGKIYNARNRLLHPYKNPATGYAHVTLYTPSGRRHTTVHRLLAETYVENGRGVDTVNHRDGDKLNNHVANLEWMTMEENNRHARESGLVPRPKYVAYQAHPRKGAVGFVLFGAKDIEAAGFNHSNFLNSIGALTPGGKRRHSKGYYPTKIS